MSGQQFRTGDAGEELVELVEGSAPASSDSSVSNALLSDAMSPAVAADDTPLLEAAGSEADAGFMGWLGSFFGWDGDASGSLTAGADGVSGQVDLSVAREDGTSAALAVSGSVGSDGPAGSLDASRGSTIRFDHADDDWEQSVLETSATAGYDGELGFSGSVGHTSTDTTHYNGHEVTSTDAVSLDSAGGMTTLGGSSTFRVEEDGIYRETEATGSLGYSEEDGWSASSGYSRSFGDGEEYRDAVAARATIDESAAMVTGTSSSFVIDADDRHISEASSVSLGLDYEHGLTGGFSESSSTVDGDDFAKRDASIGWADGGLTAGMTGSSHATDEEGIVRTTTYDHGAVANEEGMSAHVGSTTGYDDDGITRTTAANASTSFSEENGFAASADYSTELADGDEYRQSKSASATIDSKAAVVTGTSSSFVVDADGVEISESSGGDIGYNWETGFLGHWNESSSTVSGENDFARREAQLGFADGGLDASMSGATSATQEDGSVITSGYSHSAAANSEAMNASVSTTDGYSFDGIEGGRSSSATVGFTEEKGLAIDASTTRGISDGDDYHDRSTGTFTVKEGTTTVGGTNDVRWVDEDGVRHDSSHSGSVSTDGSSITGAIGESNLTTDDGVGSGIATSGSLTFGPEGPKATAERVRTTTIEEDGFSMSRGGNVSIGPDGGSIGMTDAATWTDEDGVAHGSTNSGALGINSEGHVSFTGGRTDTVTNTDGTSTETGATGSVSSDGTMSAGWSTTAKDAEGNVTGGTSVNGSLKVDEGELSAGFGVSQTFSEGRTVSGSGGYSFKLAEPVQKGGVWVVEYRQTLSAQASGGVQGASGPGASASLGGAIVAGGSRTFATEAEAKAFYASPDVGTMEGPSSNIADVLAMSAGDTSMSSFNAEVGLAGTASSGMLNGSAGITVGGSEGLTVTRGNDSMVIVGVDDGKKLAGSLGLSTVGLGLSGSASTEVFEGVTYSFDLSKESAQAAYIAYVDSGVLPTEGTDGVVQTATTHGETTTSAVTVNAAGASVSTGSSRTSSVTEDEDGNVIETDKGGTFLSATWEWLGFGQSETHELRAVQVNDSEQFLSASSTVSSTNANAAHEGLAHAAGLDSTYDDREGSGSGNWTVDTAFSEDAIDDFVGSVKSGDYNTTSGLVIGNAGEEMRDAILAANGDPDLERQALADFAAAEGHKAVDAIREYTEGEEEYLHLEDSTTFTGLQGHLATDQAIGALEATVAGEAFDAKSVYQQAETLHRTETGRKLDLDNFAKYPDLPDPLRASERARVVAFLGRLDAVMAEAATVLAMNGDAEALTLLEPNSVDDGETGLGDANMAALEAHASMEEAYTEARGRGDRHDRNRARDTLGDEGLFGWFADDEYESYLAVDDEMRLGQNDRSVGTTQELRARDFSLMIAEEAERSVAYWVSAEVFYSRAEVHFRQATANYDAIQSRNSASAGLWG